jgi:hypothetical protein
MSDMNRRSLFLGATAVIGATVLPKINIAAYDIAMRPITNWPQTQSYIFQAIKEYGDLELEHMFLR